MNRLTPLLGGGAARWVLVVLMVISLGACARRTRFEVVNAAHEDLSVELLAKDEVIAGGIIAAGGGIDVAVQVDKSARARVRRLAQRQPIGPETPIYVQPGGWTSVTVDVVDGHIIIREWRRLKNEPF